MAEGTEISEERRDEARRAGHSTAYRHRGTLQRYIDRKIDIAVYMMTKFWDRLFHPSDVPEDRAADALEETPEEELQEFEKESAEERNPDHPGEQMTGNI